MSAPEAPSLAVATGGSSAVPPGSVNTAVCSSPMFRTLLRFAFHQVLKSELPACDEPLLAVGDLDEPQLLQPTAMQWCCRGGQTSLGYGPDEVGVVRDADHPAAFAVPQRSSQAGCGLDRRAV